jgi:hypothetical protein
MDKHGYTRLFLQESGMVDPTDTEIDHFLKQWWATPFSPIGLRLSKIGDKFLAEVLKLERYTVKLKVDQQKSLKQFLQMSKYLSAPYFLPNNDTLITYGESDATILILMDGDLTTYLNNQ